MIECRCPVCGKLFYVQCDDWLYKIVIKKKTTYYCRYNCWIKVKRELEQERAGKRGCRQHDH